MYLGSEFVNKLKARDRLISALSPIVEKVGLRSYARSIHVSPPTVSKWLSGDSFPDGDNRERVAGSLGMTLDRFNAEIVRGEKKSESKPLDQMLRWINTAPASDLAIVLHAVADKLTVN